MRGLLGLGLPMWWCVFAAVVSAAPQDLTLWWWSKDAGRMDWNVAFLSLGFALLVLLREALPHSTTTTNSNTVVATSHFCRDGVMCHAFKNWTLTGGWANKAKQHNTASWHCGMTQQQRLCCGMGSTVLLLQGMGCDTHRHRRRCKGWGLVQPPALSRHGLASSFVSCLTFALPDPVLHGTMDCYSQNELPNLLHGLWGCW